MCSSPPLCTSRSMVVEEASILSPVNTERTMASDSPARSLDEIDLSALRVNVCLCVHVHVVSDSMCARACVAVEHLCTPPPFSPPLLIHSLLSIEDASPRGFIWPCCPVVSVRAFVCKCMCVGCGARARRPVIEEIRSGNECGIVRPPPDTPVVFLLMFFFPQQLGRDVMRP